MECFILVVIIAIMRLQEALDIFREACPYSTFCTTASLQTLNMPKGSRPCCYDCFCDEHCSLFGDCCPDHESSTTKTNIDVLDCKPILFASDRVKMEFLPEFQTIEQESHFRVIDSCPISLKHNLLLLEKCKGMFSGTPRLTDLVLVSDRGGRIYKNRHCDLCNGVNDVISWSLKVEECVDDLSVVQLTLSESTFFFLNYCILTPERPPEIAPTTRTMPCARERTCSGEDPKLVEACVNGPYMPYMDPLLTRLYKNAICYQLCVTKEKKSVCPDYDDADCRFSGNSYRTLLNVRPEIPPSAPVKTTCIESEIMDRYIGRCRRVLCPPFEVISYGRCIPLSQGFTDLFLTVRVMYTLKERAPKMTFTPVGNYNKTLRDRYIKDIYSKYEYPDCKIVQVFVNLKTEKRTKMFIRLELIMTYKINRECSIQAIATRIRDSKGVAGDEVWFVKDRFFAMEGRFFFYWELSEEEINKISVNTLMFIKPSVVKITAVEQFFLCPYFKLRKQEYISYMERRKGTSKEYNVTELLPWSPLFPGFYSITQREVAVCVDTYQPNNGKNSDTVCTVVVFISIVAGSMNIWG